MLWGLILSCLFCRDSNTPDWDTGVWWDSGDPWGDDTADCDPWITIRWEDQALDALDFGTVGTTDAVEVTLTVLNKGDCDLEVSDARIADLDAPFTVEALEWPIIAPEETAELVLTFEPSEPGQYSTSLEVDSNDPFEPTYTIALTGELVSGGLEVSPSEITFEDVEVGCMVEEMAALSNVGAGPVTIESVVLEAGSDEITASSDSVPATLQSGESLDLLVAYEPTDDFADEAFLQISSTDPTNPELLVGIDATGVYTETLTDVFEQEGARRVFFLSAVAVDSSVEVRVSGVLAGGWTFDGSANAVVFDEGNVPSEGAEIQVDYARQPVCE